MPHIRVQSNYSVSERYLAFVINSHKLTNVKNSSLNKWVQDLSSQLAAPLISYLPVCHAKACGEDDVVS